jgi:hypothetical protein
MKAIGFSKALHGYGPHGLYGTIRVAEMATSMSVKSFNV